MKFDTTFNVEATDDRTTAWTVAAFNTLILKSELNYTFDWQISSETEWETVLNAVDGNVAAYTLLPASGYQRAMIERGDHAYLLGRSRASVWYVTAAAKTEEVLQQQLNRMVELLPPLVTDEPNVVPVRFWSLSARGEPVSVTRKLNVPSWRDIEGNYPTVVRAGLQQLVELQEPDTGGKLILAHGVPGTGKSWFLRALAQATRSWADMHYIIDPDQMFSRAYYLLSTVLDEEDKNRWRLIVVEDSGEFMLKNAKEQTGQGLSRLLNLTDGMLGQGLKFLLLLTTNEPFRDLHAAVKRPGRCLFDIDFHAFTRSEAAAWLDAHDWKGSLPSGNEFTLAELYKLVGTPHERVTPKLAEVGGYA